MSPTPLPYLGPSCIHFSARTLFAVIAESFLEIIATLVQIQVVPGATEAARKYFTSGIESTSQEASTSKPVLTTYATRSISE